MASLLERITKRLEAEEQKFSLDTGRGKGKDTDKHAERIGYSKGLLQALEWVKDEAKAFNDEER